MEELIRKQTEETKAINPEAGIVSAILEHTEKGDDLTISISASAEELALIIDNILDRYPQVRNELIEMALSRSISSIIQRLDEENATERFREVF